MKEFSKFECISKFKIPTVKYKFCNFFFYSTLICVFDTSENLNFYFVEFSNFDQKTHFFPFLPKKTNFTPPLSPKKRDFHPQT